MEIVVGAYVVNKARATGVITAFDGKHIIVSFGERTATFGADALEKGFLQYQDAQLQSKVNERIAQAKCAEALIRTAMEQADRERQQIQAELSKAHRRVTVVSAAYRLDAAPITLTSVRKKDQALVQKIFAQCDQETRNLYSSAIPEMEYMEKTSYKRSKYGVGFLCKYSDTYVFRLFSRNDSYKKNAQNFITVTESDTTEVLRVLQVNGKLYIFSKNLASAGGYLVNTKANCNWHVSDLHNSIMANEVIRVCDCAYLNDYIETRNIDCLQFLKLLMPAFHDNKVEIVLKHRLFKEACRIDDLSAYLQDYTPKQINLACENKALNALPFMKRYGNLEPGILRNLDAFLRKSRNGRSVYGTLQTLLERCGLSCPDLEQKVVGFLKKVDYFNARIYLDYICMLVGEPGVTLQDFFDKDYVDRHFILIDERQTRYTLAEDTAYQKVAEELSWIDRQDDDYYIILPKCIADFRYEGARQHNCVYTNGYYQLVISRESIIVFLRKEKNTPFVTIEYDYETFEVLQARSKYNEEISPELYDYIVKLGEQLYYQMRSHQ